MYTSGRNAEDESPGTLTGMTPCCAPVASEQPSEIDERSQCVTLRDDARRCDARSWSARAKASVNAPCGREMVTRSLLRLALLCCAARRVHAWPACADQVPPHGHPRRACCGRRTRLLVQVHRECRLAGLTQEQTWEQLALWIRDVDEVDPAGAPPPTSDWGKRGVIPLAWAFASCDRRLPRRS